MTLLTLKKLCQHLLTCLRIFNKLLLHQLDYTTSKTKLRQITSTDLNLQGHLISFSTQVQTQVLLAPKSKIKWLIYLFRQTAYNNLTNGSRLRTKPIKIFRYFENLVLIKVPLLLAQLIRARDLQLVCSEIQNRISITTNQAETLVALLLRGARLKLPQAT